MLKFARKPDQSSYRTQMPGALSAILQSPQSKFRKDVERNSFQVSVSWTFDAYGYQYARSFYRGGTSKGADAFTIDLILGNSTPAEYTAIFVPGSWMLASVKNQTFVVSATLEVTPL